MNRYHTARVQGFGSGILAGASLALLVGLAWPAPDTRPSPLPAKFFELADAPSHTAHRHSSACSFVADHNAMMVNPVANDPAAGLSRCWEPV